MKVMCTQPQLFPDMRFIELIAATDRHVMMTGAQYVRKYDHSRFRLWNPNKDEWDVFSLPVSLPNGRETLISEALVLNDQRWLSKLEGSVLNWYGDGAMTQDFVGMIKVWMDEGWNLAKVGIDSIEWVCCALETSFAELRDIDIVPNRPEDPSEWILRLCLQAEATTYYCGKKSGRKYLDWQRFAKYGIEIACQCWEMPEPPIEVRPELFGNVCSADCILRSQKGRKYLDLFKIDMALAKDRLAKRCFNEPDLLDP